MKSPIYSPKAWLRVALRVVVLFVIFDAAFIALRPFDRLQPLSIYGSLVPYHTRLTTLEPDMSDQLVSIDTLLKAHEVASPKAPNEYRVIVLGDSGINGVGNFDSETISAYMTAAQLSIEGKRVRAYNLANPYPSAIRDLVIADAALQYKPDMVIWFVSKESFTDNPDRMIAASGTRMTQLTAQFHLDDANAKLYGHVVELWWQRSILVKRTDILQWLRFQTFIFHQTAPYRLAAKTYLQIRSAPPKPSVATIAPTWAALTALPQLTPIPVLIVNEPILSLAPDTSAAYKEYNTLMDIPHNEDYRKLLARFCADHSLWCLDLGELIPADQYTDSPFHRTADANAIIAANVIQAIHEHFSTAVF